MKYNKIGSVPYTHMTSVSYPRTRYAINENRPSLVLSTPSGVIMSNFCSWSISSLNSFCSTCFTSQWCLIGLAIRLKLQQKCAFKAPNAIKTLSNTLCIFVSIQCFSFCLPQYLDMTGNNLLLC